MSASYPDSPAGTPAPANGKKTLAIVAIVLGALGILFVLLLPIVGILFGIAAVVLGFMSRSREAQARTMALVGIILGFIAIAVNVVLMILAAIAVAAVMNGQM